MKYFYSLILLAGLLFFNNSASAQLEDSVILRAFNAYSASNVKEDAIVLYDNMVTTFLHNEAINILYKKSSYHYIVKIIDEKALNLGDVKAYYYPFSHPNPDVSRKFVLNNIKGYTYNVIDGKVSRVKLDEKNILEREIVNGVVEVSFTLTNVKKGSIIEYSYDQTEPIDVTIESWNFQEKYPVVFSEYTLITPKGLSISSSLRSTPVFKEYSSVKNARLDNSNAYYINESGNGEYYTTQTWGRLNIPAYREEPMINDITDHIEHLDLQVKTINIAELRSFDLYSSWDRFNLQMLNEDYFGKYIGKKNSYLNDKVQFLIKGKTSQKEKAYAIYNYIRSSFICDDTLGIQPSKYLEGVYNNKRGSATSINTLLLLMLDKAGLDVYPVVLSTIGNGKPDTNYPFLRYFNYMVCAVKENGMYTYLDATSKFNPYGILPDYCYNGYARILIQEKGESINLDSKLLKEKNNIMAVVNTINPNEMEIDITKQYSLRRSRQIRIEAFKQKDRSDNYFKKLAEATDAHNVAFTDVQVFNLDNVDTNIVLKYKCKTIFEKEISTLYFHTDFIRFLSASPFTDNVRTLPIEFPFKEDYNYVLQMKVPDNVSIEDLPKPTVLNFDNDKLLFKHLIGYDTSIRQFTVNTRYQINETTFPVQAYDVIKDFYRKAIEESNRVLTFKFLR